jgi:holo-[acyl-carrier protein] synthase
MEIAGIGTDIVECLRIGRMIEQHGEIFLTRIFTMNEIRYCQTQKRTTENFAALWAGKEAVLKSLGTSWKRGLNFTDVEIRADRGKSTVTLSGTIKDIAQSKRVVNFLLSLAHSRAYATAFAIAVRGGTVHHST